MQFHLMMVRLEMILIAIAVFFGTLVSEGKLIRQIRQLDCSESVKVERFNISNPQCYNVIAHFNGSFDDYYRDIYCSSESSCGHLSLLYQISQCPGKDSHLLLEYYDMLCGVNENGMPCYTFLDDPFIPRQSAIIRFNLHCLSAMPNECNDECRSLLTDINKNTTRLGCCVQTYYNSSYHRREDSDFSGLFSYELWTACGLQTRGESCSSNDSMLKASVLPLIFSAVVATLILSGTAIYNENE